MHDDNELISTALRLQEGLESLEGRITSEIRYLLMEVYDLAHEFERNSPSWVEFVGLECWEKCHKKRPYSSCGLEAKLHWLTRFVYRGFDTRSSRYNRAFKAAKSLIIFANRGFTKDQVLDSLLKRGVDHAYLRSLETSAFRADVDSEEVDDTASHTAMAPGPRANRVEDSGEQEPGASTTLEVKMTNARLLRIANMPPGAVGRLTVVRGPEISGWFTVTATKLKVE